MMGREFYLSIASQDAATIDRAVYQDLVPIDYEHDVVRLKAEIGLLRR